jgi:hypothetical protein
LNGLKLLVHCPNLDPITKEAIGWEIRTGVGGKVTRIPLESMYPYFAEGYVDADKPRDSAYTNDVVAECKGWGLADANGNVLGQYATVAEAEEARKNAKQTVEFSLAPEDDEPVVKSVFPTAPFPVPMTR